MCKKRLNYNFRTHQENEIFKVMNLLHHSSGQTFNPNIGSPQKFKPKVTSTWKPSFYQLLCSCILILGLFGLWQVARPGVWLCVHSFSIFPILHLEIDTNILQLTVVPRLYCVIWSDNDVSIHGCQWYFHADIFSLHSDHLFIQQWKFKIHQAKKLI